MPFRLSGGMSSASSSFSQSSNSDVDGFFFSLELYTEWGQAWTGETGGFEISCSDPATSTGICPYFDPDGPAGVIEVEIQGRAVVVVNQLMQHNGFGDAAARIVPRKVAEFEVGGVAAVVVDAQAEVVGICHDAR